MLHFYKQNYRLAKIAEEWTNNSINNQMQWWLLQNIVSHFSPEID